MLTSIFLPLRISKSILTIPSWVLFISFFVGVFSSHYIALGAARYFEWSLDYGPYPTLRFALIALVFCTYPYLVVQVLSRLTGSNSTQTMTLVIILALVNNAISVYLSEAYGLLWYVMLVTVLINIFCLAKIFSLPARILRSIEQNRTARFSDYLPDLIQFMVWPICVWPLQRRGLAAVDKEPVVGMKK